MPPVSRRRAHPLRFFSRKEQTRYVDVHLSCLGNDETVARENVVLRLLDPIYEALARFFGVYIDTAQWTRRCTLLLPVMDSSYLQLVNDCFPDIPHVRTTRAFSYNFPNLSVVCLCQADRGMRSIKDVLEGTSVTAWVIRQIVHEFCHQFSYVYQFRPMPVWLSEGLCEYCSSWFFEKSTGTVRLGKDVTTRWPTVQRYLHTLLWSQPQLPTFAALMSWGDYKGNADNMFARSWSFVEFLFVRHPHEAKEWIAWMTSSEPPPRQVQRPMRVLSSADSKTTVKQPIVSCACIPRPRSSIVDRKTVATPELDVLRLPWFQRLYTREVEAEWHRFLRDLWSEMSRRGAFTRVLFPKGCVQWSTNYIVALTTALHAD